MRKYGIEYWDEPRSGGAITPKLRQAGARERARAQGHAPGPGVVPAAPAPGSPTGGTGAARPDAPARPPQVVVKVVHWGKTPGQASRLADYIGRTVARHQEGREVPPAGLPLETDTGARVTGKAEIEAALSTWDLRTNAENRPPGFERLTPAERAALPADKALRHRQYAHIVITLPKEFLARADGLEHATREALSETFGRAGHRYIFALHTDTGRPHVHVVVGARSGPDAAGRRRQLRLGPAELDGFRALVADRLRAQGIEVEASRRVDRPELRERIERGQAPASSPTRPRAGQAPGPDRQARAFRTAAPAWYDRHGADYERRRLDPSHDPEPHRENLAASMLIRIGLRERPIEIRLPRPATEAEARALRRLAEHADRLYRRPEAAAARFLEMHRESPRAAIWAMNNHPGAFGAVRPDAEPAGPFTGRGLPRSHQAQAPARPAPAAPLRAAADQAAADRRADRDLDRVPDLMRRAAHDLRSSAAGDPAATSAAAVLAAAAEQHPRAARGLARLDVHLRQVYSDPSSARAGFLAAYQLDPKAAIAAMNDDPGRYGTVKAPPTQRFTGRGIPRDQADREPPTASAATPARPAPTATPARPAPTATPARPAPTMPAEPRTAPASPPRDERAAQGLARLDAHVRQVYALPATARAAFLRAYQLDPKAAIAAMNDDPGRYGTVKAPPTQRFTGRGIPRDQAEREAAENRSSRSAGPGRTQGIDI